MRDPQLASGSLFLYRHNNNIYPRPFSSYVQLNGAGVNECPFASGGKQRVVKTWAASLCSERACFFFLGCDYSGLLLFFASWVGGFLVQMVELQQVGWNARRTSYVLIETVQAVFRRGFGAW